ncbi:hypothetical protein MVEN_00372800 [Mycena venus]|uniref:Ubiquitin-like protease family profile domain-containing protein n=1 Tax=Mycena venus TaxID=2733690 RepID=A0A8H6YUB6_9AGAR|nr:hypothetical protein MVEN_00372800 [Mycena venus]
MSGSSNPFSAGRLTNNLHGGKANPAARGNVIDYAARNGPPPNKKARMEAGVRSRKKVSQQPSNIEPSRLRRLGDPDDTDIIYVDDEYEDVGQPVSRAAVEADDLNIASSRASGSSRRDSHPVPDGEATAQLRLESRKLLPAPEDNPDSDPIEILHLPLLPWIAKSPSLILRASSLTKPPFLPIKAWYLGRKYFEEPYHLLWNAAGKMTIRSGGDPKAAAKHSEEIDIGMVAEQVSFVPPEESADKFFGMQTFGKFPKNKAGNQKPFGTQYVAYFKQGGTHGEGEIMISFDNASPAWADTSYVQFVEWLKEKVQKRETLRGKAAGGAKWEKARRMAELLETRVRREASHSVSSAIPKAGRAKSPAAPGIPRLDNRSPPATIAIANTATRSKRQSSPNSPIEVGSPTPIRPRPPNTFADSDTAGGGHESVRRSARQSSAPQRPHVDLDEVILVYPPGQTGAVNITNGDVSRLVPGEFLNDTLIEFGLKLWLQDLGKENPELVKQIHVFSSFFYKKLDNKDDKERTGQEKLEKGYESVRKWTAKFDLFGKKYIIVPINENLHWYLAIIYQPEHTLKPPPPPPPKKSSPSTRRKTREEAEQSLEMIEAATVSNSSKPRPPNSKASSATRRTPSPIETAVSAEDSGTLSPSSNVQAEVEVADQLVSCSITDDDLPPCELAEKPEACDTEGDCNSLFSEAEDDGMDVDDVEVLRATAVQPLPPAGSEVPVNHDGSHTASEEPADLEVMDVDANAMDPDESMDPLLLATNFYGSAKSRGKRKAESPLVETFPPTQDVFPSEAWEDEAEAEVEDGQPSTYVFILDSLGGRHTRVYNVLGSYLQFEARERKGLSLDMSRKPIGKQAHVPHQPNFCDCGIYLLHLAQTFISDPEHYFNLITKKRKGRTPNSLDRQLQWKDDQTKTLRQSLADRITELSEEWKKNRAAQKELKKKEDSVPESSDDEVDIVETTPAPPPRQNRQKKTPKTGRALRLR